MIAVIQPSRISGNIQAPASKSSMQRACAAALLSGTKNIIHNPGHSNDDHAALDIIKKLGAEVTVEEHKLLITGTGVIPGADEVNCGESGLSIRMFTPLIALSEKEMTINGEGSLLKRPMDFFDEILPQIGVQVKSNKGKLPIRVKGPLRPADIRIDGSLSSQFLTGLLMAYAAAGARDVTITVDNLTSKPYIDLTLDVMKKFGLKLPENKNYGAFYFGNETDGPSEQTNEYTVEGDWSGGAFLLVAGAIAGPVTVRGLDMNSTQADRAMMLALGHAHAEYAIEAKGIKLRPSAMKAFHFDATECPDLFPPLVALAAFCKGATKIKGVRRLAHKESNRSIALKQEFGKMGVLIEVDDDTMTIHGEGKVHGAAVHAHHDHRIAMACAVAALGALGPTTIGGAEAVKKSYPSFYEDLEKLGAGVSLSTSIRFHE